MSLWNAGAAGLGADAAVALAAITGQGLETPIVTSNSASLTHWRDELLAETTLAADEIGEC